MSVTTAAAAQNSSRIPGAGLPKQSLLTLREKVGRSFGINEGSTHRLLLDSIIQPVTLGHLGEERLTEDAQMLVGDYEDGDFVGNFVTATPHRVLHVIGTLHASLTLDGDKRNVLALALNRPHPKTLGDFGVMIERDKVTLSSRFAEEIFEEVDDRALTVRGLVTELTPVKEAERLSSLMEKNVSGTGDLNIDSVLWLLTAYSRWHDVGGVSCRDGKLVSRNKKCVILHPAALDIIKRAFDVKSYFGLTTVVSGESETGGDSDEAELEPKDEEYVEAVRVAVTGPVGVPLKSVIALRLGKARSGECTMFSQAQHRALDRVAQWGDDATDVTREGESLLHDRQAVLGAGSAAKPVLNFYKAQINVDYIMHAALQLVGIEEERRKLFSHEHDVPGPITLMIDGKDAVSVKRGVVTIHRSCPALSLIEVSQDRSPLSSDKKRNYIMLTDTEDGEHELHHVGYVFDRAGKVDRGVFKQITSKSTRRFYKLNADLIGERVYVANLDYATLTRLIALMRRQEKPGEVFANGDFLVKHTKKGNIKLYPLALEVLLWHDAHSADTTAA
jgi:hypothetical protein